MKDQVFKMGCGASRRLGPDPDFPAPLYVLSQIVPNAPIETYRSTRVVVAFLVHNKQRIPAAYWILDEPNWRLMRTIEPIRPRALTSSPEQPPNIFAVRLLSLHADGKKATASVRDVELATLYRCQLPECHPSLKSPAASWMLVGLFGTRHPPAPNRHRGRLSLPPYQPEWPKLPSSRRDEPVRFALFEDASQGTCRAALVAVYKDGSTACLIERVVRRVSSKQTRGPTEIVFAANAGSIGLDLQTGLTFGRSFYRCAQTRWTWDSALTQVVGGHCVEVPPLYDVIGANLEEELKRIQNFPALEPEAKVGYASDPIASANLPSIYEMSPALKARVSTPSALDLLKLESRTSLEANSQTQIK